MTESDPSESNLEELKKLDESQPTLEEMSERLGKIVAADGFVTEGFSLDLPDIDEQDLEH